MQIEKGRVADGSKSMPPIFGKVPVDSTPTPKPMPSCMDIACLGWDLNQTQLIRVVDMSKQ